MWIEAMNNDLSSLEANETWELTTLLAGHKTIPSKQADKVKFNPDGIVEIAKARLVICGLIQQEGIGYTLVFPFWLKQPFLQ